MTLEEAKKECKDLVKEYLSCSVVGLNMQVDVGFNEERCEAIDTVLKALEDSISKDEVRNKMEEMNKIIKNAKPIEAVFMIKQQEILHELLMGE